MDILTDSIKNQKRADSVYLPVEADILESRVYNRGAPGESDYVPVIRYRYVVSGNEYRSELLVRS